MTAEAALVWAMAILAGALALGVVISAVTLAYVIIRDDS